MVSEFMFTQLVYGSMSSVLVILFTCLLDPTTAHLHPAKFHIWEAISFIRGSSSQPDYPMNPNLSPHL